MENPIKMDDLGVPLFLGNTHMSTPTTFLSSLIHDRSCLHGHHVGIDQLWVETAQARLESSIVESLKGKDKSDTPPIDKALLRDYENPLVSLDFGRKLGPYFLGGLGFRVPENGGPLEKEIPIGNHHFQVPC